MSTYCSDMDLSNQLEADPTLGFIDVAYCCFGRDVRLVVRDGTVRMGADMAREMARALHDAADTLDGINEHLSTDRTIGDPS